MPQIRFWDPKYGSFSIFAFFSTEMNFRQEPLIINDAAIVAESSSLLQGSKTKKYKQIIIDHCRYLGSSPKIVLNIENNFSNFAERRKQSFVKYFRSFRAICYFCSIFKEIIKLRMGMLHMGGKDTGGEKFWTCCKGGRKNLTRCKGAI